MSFAPSSVLMTWTPTLATGELLSSAFAALDVAPLDSGSGPALGADGCIVFADVQQTHESAINVSVRKLDMTPAYAPPIPNGHNKRLAEIRTCATDGRAPLSPRQILLKGIPLLKTLGRLRSRRIPYDVHRSGQHVPVSSRVTHW